MRVAVVSDAVFPYHTGGKETRYRHIVAQLCDQGHHVTVYTMHWWPGAKTKTGSSTGQLWAARLSTRAAGAAFPRLCVSPSLVSN
jgi:hypothetical protein